MTAFGSASCGQVGWEIRSVNHRYLELSFRLPEPFRDLESNLRAVTSRRLKRGKVDATLRVAGDAAVSFRLNEDALGNLLDAVAEVGKHTAVGSLDALDLMRWPGLLEHDETDLAYVKETALESYGAALDALVAQRRSEGANLEELLRERLTEAAQIGARVRALTAAQGETLAERLQVRVRELVGRFEGGALDESRLAQEAALLAQRADVTEELDRVDIHVAEAEASLNGDEPCGRRLDFLMQELNREASTLAAKSALPEVSRLAVDLKVAIEQLREQAQNVE